ncbi:MAG: hypothetical protein PHH29_17155 [Desulfuromonadaceae bacterium]|nr:hypothetical protein [Desulfuromonadaceae bacterium]
MADIGMDFGQSSQEKYSLRPFLNKQETPIPIAHDMAQAIQVADNAFKAYKGVEDEANQHKYFNAVTDFNNINVEHQDALANVGEDLGKQAELKDAYRSKREYLITKYELNDKYAAELGSKITSVNNHHEETYRTKYNVQQGSIADGNIAEVMASSIGNSKPEDIKITLEALLAYRKQMTGDDDRTNSIKTNKTFMNAAINSIDSQTIIFDQARQLKKDTLSTVLSLDPKMAGTEEFKQYKGAFDVIEEHTRKKEEEIVKDMVNAATVPEKIMFSRIDSELKRGTIQTPEQAILYKELYKNKIREKVAQEEALQTKLQTRTEKHFEDLTKYSGMPVEEVRALLDKDVKANKLDKDRADFLYREYVYTTDKQQKKANDGAVKEVLARLENDKGSSNDWSKKDYLELVRKKNEGFVVSAEELYKADVQGFKYLADKNESAFLQTSYKDLPVQEQKAYKEVASSQINKAYASTDINRIAKIATLNMKTLADGDIKEFVSSQIQDPKKFQGVYNDYVQLKEALPNSYKQVMGEDNVAVIHIAERLRTLSGKQTIDADIIAKATEQAKQKIDFTPEEKKKIDEAIKNNKISDVNGFREAIVDNMKIGQTLSSSIETTIKETAPMVIGGRVDLTSLKGITLDTKKKDLISSYSELLSNESKGLINGAIYNKGTKTMWLSVEGNRYGFNSGMSFEEYLKEAGSTLTKYGAKELATTAETTRTLGGYYD